MTITIEKASITTEGGTTVRLAKCKGGWHVELKSTKYPGIHRIAGAVIQNEEDGVQFNMAYRSDFSMTIDVLRAIADLMAAL